jgi:hypothetical protein
MRSPLRRAQPQIIPHPRSPRRWLTQRTQLNQVSAQPPLPRTARKRKNTKQRPHTYSGVASLVKVALPSHPTAQPKEKLRVPHVPSSESLRKSLLNAPRPVGKAPPIREQLRNVARFGWLNLLFLFIPVPWAAVSGFPPILFMTIPRCAGSSLIPPVLLAYLLHRATPTQRVTFLFRTFR